VWRFTQNTDFNGIVLFDPAALVDFYGGRIRKGTNLFRKFTTTDDGDEMLRLGIVVPVLAIDDAGYTVIVRTADESSPVESCVMMTNGAFPLYVRGEAVLADLAVFREWEYGTDWTHVPIAVGRYSVDVRGFRRLATRGRNILDAGYEFVLKPVRRLPRVTGETGMKMQTLRFD
jgi:hypothetical protein